MTPIDRAWRSSLTSPGVARDLVIFMNVEEYLNKVQSLTEKGDFNALFQLADEQTSKAHRVVALASAAVAGQISALNAVRELAALGRSYVEAKLCTTST